MAFHQLVSFNIGDEDFAVDINLVTGILKYKSFTISKVPNSPQELEGFINLRGKITPVYNLKKKFRYSDTSISQDSKIISVSSNDTITGFIVDDVTDIFKISDEDIEPFPANIGECSYIEGIGKVEGNMIVILNLVKVLSNKDISHINSIKNINI